MIFATPWVLLNFNTLNVALNIMKPHFGATLLIKGFPTVPRAWWEAPWFGRSQHDRQTN